FNDKVNCAVTGLLVEILKTNSAANRFLYLKANLGTLAISTAGATKVRLAEAGFAVAATPAAAAWSHPLTTQRPPGLYSYAFNGSEHVESFSSDGPRRIFFTADSSPITPGNFSSSGGLVCQKPDITAADGVAVTGVGGFPFPDVEGPQWFYG